MAASYDLIVIGGGPSGMAAAIRAKEKGVKDILIIEREEDLGGALVPCIHNGFGKEVLGKEATGPELIHFFISKLNEFNIEYKLSTIVIDFNSEGIVTYMNPKEGICFIKAKSVIFATGSREKYTGKIHIATKNYSGIYTLGTVHRLINLQGYLPGKEVVIMDSSDIAMTVARSLVVEGADVKAIIESSSEIKATQSKNKEIPKDFNIPILYNSVIKEVMGKERVSKVKILNKETNEYSEIDCDGLVLSVAWRSEIDLLKKARIKIEEDSLTPLINEELMTSQKGVFVCGTLINTKSLVKEAIETGYIAGEAAEKYIKEYMNIYS
jgi:sarcosine oxidase subunit alpha